MGGGTVAVLDLDKISDRGLAAETLAVTATISGFANPQAVAIDPNGMFLLVADAEKKQIVKVRITETAGVRAFVPSDASAADVDNIEYDCKTVTPASVAIQS